MARYLDENEIPAGCNGHDFIGWDDLDDRSTEATDPAKLGRLMGRALKAEFRKMAPGTRIKLPSGRHLFREF